MYRLERPRTLIAVGSITFALAACGDALEQESASADITAATAFGKIPCLPGVDADGDGVTDYYRLAGTRPKMVSSVKACFASGGTPLETWTPRPRPLTLAASQAAQAVAVPPPPTNYPEGGDLPPGVGQDVHDTGVPDPEGWREGHNDCDDFASDLERALEKQGYDATYTEICLPGSPATWHAITDIHFDGTVYWVDGQTGLQVKLDGNGNGSVDTSTTGSPCAGATEGAWGIRVWPDRATRIRELGPVD